MEIQGGTKYYSKNEQLKTTAKVIYIKTRRASKAIKINNRGEQVYKEK